MLQLPFLKTSVTDWSTGGVNQLDSVGEQGKDLTGNNKRWHCYDLALSLRFVSISQRKKINLTMLLGPQEFINFINKEMMLWSYLTHNSKLQIQSVPHGRLARLQNSASHRLNLLLTV